MAARTFQIEAMLKLLDLYKTIFSLSYKSKSKLKITKTIHLLNAHYTFTLNILR